MVSLENSPNVYRRSDTSFLQSLLEKRRRENTFNLFYEASIFLISGRVQEKKTTDQYYSGKYMLKSLGKHLQMEFSNKESKLYIMTK